ncbi:exodeoxyribonuclease V subunit alpha [uncultured Friedmanniella sp.]|uniref:exodeoxyribonuclease V subunit alpha n=1 Tax=uncultured Friedmanniella sp. TaxID=335381 RepID=UPI0035CB385A
MTASLGASADIRYPVPTPGDPAVVLGASGLLGEFNGAGVLRPADVHTAAAVARMAGEDDDRVRLALALAVRALRNGSVAVDLRTVNSTVFDESEEQVDVTGLPWPDPERWLDACRQSPLVLGQDESGGRPLRLAGELLYLERYWQQEELVRTSLQARFAAGCFTLDVPRVAAALRRLFPHVGLADDEPDRQQLAAAVSALSRVTVLAGGPGTGKTTTVARLLALLHDQPGPRLRIALAAPTGKAAARLEEAVRGAAATLDPADRDRIGPVSASTLHRLLGWQPGSRSRFRHDATNHLPHDVLIVDEMSMVSLTMMARLLEAVRPDARLVLVGDPDQLSSVEAGAVLADIANAPGPAAPELIDGLERLDLPALDLRLGRPEPPVHGVVQLTRPWRYGGSIDAMARAIRREDADTVLAVLRSEAPDVGFCEVELDPATGRVPGIDDLAELTASVVEAGRLTRDAAEAGDVRAALQGLDHHRLLCAHRRGPYGVTRWSVEAERWLVEAVPGYGEDGEWYLGRPLLITANDYEMSLYNGDTGVVVQTPGGPRAAFARGAEPTLVAPVRLDAVQTVHAMTVHRAQGSQFTRVTFVVPAPDSPLLTRELLYTAVTRATSRVLVLGTEEAVRRAVLRPALRASGLRHRLAQP